MEIVQKFQDARINESAEDIVGGIRINPKCFTDAFIDDPKGGVDILIEGSASRSVALDGDIVKVRLNPSKYWKLKYNAIATRWDDWSEYLLPIISDIENAEAAEQLGKTNHGETIKSTPTSESNFLDQLPAGSGLLKTDQNQGNKRRSLRNKRSIPEQNGNEGNKNDKSKQAQASVKLPSNLPSGIARLQVKHILNLPFASQCIQKTGRVLEIVRSNHTGLAGGYLKPHSATHALFSPMDHRIPRMLIDLAECPLDFATLSDRYKDILFVAKITALTAAGFAQGSLIKIIGESNSIEARMETLLVENQIFDHDFAEDAYKELEYLKNLPQDWVVKNGKGRRDLQNECIFTIDPKTARDLDDAVSIKKLNDDIYEVGVHIADVAYFVKELSAVDYYARLRTTSVYLVDRVIPMLPRPLCEHMCSLNPGEPKFTFSVLWKMDKNGHIIDEWFGRTIIKSCVKLAYEQAQDMIDRPGDLSWIEEGVNMPKLFNFNWKKISESVNLLHDIATKMRTKRFEGGALRIDQVKLKYELDLETGFPTGMTFEERNSANYLIEEFMLQANMSVAKRIYKHSEELAFLRRHPSSSPSVLKEVKEFCDAKGYPLDITSAGSIQQSLNAIRDKTASKVVSFLLLRAMKNAEYICTGSLPADDMHFRHFALNVPFYTHFTSPIRRYADLIVHRQLAVALNYDAESQEDVSSLTSMAAECTKRKISSKQISEASQKLYFCLFVSKAGHCELLACVTRIIDKSFDVILVDYNQSGRVYVDRVKDHLDDFKFESFAGITRLVLKWKPLAKKNKNKKAKKKKGLLGGIEDVQQLNHRSNMETRRTLWGDDDMKINEALGAREQIIQVFDVIRVIVTVDEKDISKLKIDLKPPIRQD